MIAGALDVSFQRENVKTLWPEVQPLLAEHWREIAHYKDIALDPDRDFYTKADELGMLRVFTARGQSVLLGYCVFFVKPHPHYRKTIYANQDVLFIHPDHRGFGRQFISWCDKQLRHEGVNIVTQHLKAAHDFGSLLKRLGYELQDHVYSRRLA